MLEPLSSDARNARLRARLEGSTRRGTQAPGGGQRGIGKWKPTEGDDEGERGVGCQWTPERRGYQGEDVNRLLKSTKSDTATLITAEEISKVSLGHEGIGGHRVTNSPEEISKTLG